jgi:hypothetical protein
MKVLCTKTQKDLTENKLYKIVDVKPVNRIIHYKVVTDDGKLKWYESNLFKYPINKILK